MLPPPSGGGQGRWATMLPPPSGGGQGRWATMLPPPSGGGQGRWATMLPQGAPKNELDDHTRVGPLAPAPAMRAKTNIVKSVAKITAKPRLIGSSFESDNPNPSALSGDALRTTPYRISVV